MYSIRRYWTRLGGFLERVSSCSLSIIKCMEGNPTLSSAELADETEFQPPIFSLPINDTDPVFFYCSAPGACLQGMVGVVNPVGVNTPLLSLLQTNTFRILRGLMKPSLTIHKMQQ